MTPEEEARLLQRIGTGNWLPHVLDALVGLGVPDHLADSPRPAAHIASETGTHPDALARTLRVVAGLGFFTEGPAGCFALNDAGRLLRSDSPSPLRGLLSVGIRRMLPLFAELPHTLRTGEPAAEKLYGMPYFEYLATHSEAGQEFDRQVARSAVAVFEAALSGDVLDGARTVVDIGGGDGTLLELALRARPGLRGVLLERPTVIGAAARRMRAAGLDGRCELVPGDFFTSVPGGGDVYVIARCLHNWDDARAVDVLRAVRAAMGPDSRLLVLEEVVPEHREEAGGAGTAHSDILMLLIGGRERTADGYRELLREAGLETFAVRPVATVEARAFHLIEAAPAAVAPARGA